MSSSQRSLSTSKNLPLNNYVTGPTYIYPPNQFEVGDPPSVRLIPFDYLKNGELELKPDSYFIDIQQENHYFPGYDNINPVRMLGGHNMVTSIGPNLTAYISDIYNNKFTTEGGVNSVSVYSPGVVTKVQQLDLQVIGPAKNTLDTTPEAGRQSGDSLVPPTANYITGDATNNFNTTYIFESPLTLKISFNNGMTRYYTFKS
jgi:hypothetical protein